MVFSLFRPRCPLNAAEKTWIEYRISWLLERLGTDRLNQIETVLPTGEFFPLPYHGEPEQVQSVFEKVCHYMQVKPELYRVHLFNDETDARELPPREVAQGAIYEDHSKSDSAKGNQIATFHIHEDLTSDLELVIAIFSRKISESFLRSETDQEMEELEYRHTIELMPLFYGMGILCANSVMREPHLTAMGWHSWSMISTGTLPARYYGYALAVLCWLRRETGLPWRTHLRRDAEETLRASLRYLDKTGDCILDRDFPAAKPYLQQSPNQWFADLDEGTPGRRVAALEAIQKNPGVIHPGEEIRRIENNLSHRDPVVRAYAAGTLDRLGETAQQAVPQLVMALNDRHGSVRTAAALALGKMTSDAEQILPDLIPLLKDRNIHVCNAAAWALGQFGPQAEEAGPALVHLLRRGILRCTQDSLEDILDALLAVTDHPEEVITDTLIERDAESCQRALDLLKEHQLDKLAAKS